MPTKTAAVKKSPAAESKVARPKPDATKAEQQTDVAPAPLAEAATVPDEPAASATPDAPAAPMLVKEQPAADEAVADATTPDEAASPEAAPAAAAAEAEEEEDEEEDDSPPLTAAQQRPHGGHHMMGRSQAIAPGGRIMPPPRAMAKAEIFEEGDHVVYPTHGVGKVERIATEEIAGHKLELIHITFEENRMTLRVPVAKARTAGLRKLATRKMFDEALAVLRGRARIKRTMWSRRAQEYEAKINSGDPLAIAEVVRDLHRNAGQPDQSFSERQIYEAAMDRLAAELGALDRIDKAAASVKLAEFLKTVA